MSFTQFSSWNKEVHSFSIKFHCSGSIFWYTQTSTNVKSQLSVMTTVRLYACLTATMHSLNNILNAYMLNIILFLDKTSRQFPNIYWRWYPVSHAIAQYILNILNGRHDSWYVICVQNILSQTSCMGRCIVMLKYPPPPAAFRRFLGMKGMTLNVISAEPSSINISTQKNKQTVFLKTGNEVLASQLPTSVYYNDTLHSNKIPPTDFLQVATYPPSVFSN